MCNKDLEVAPQLQNKSYFVAEELLQHAEAENQAFKRARVSGRVVCSPRMFRSADFQLLQLSGRRAASTQHMGKSASLKVELDTAELKPVFTEEAPPDPALQAAPLALLPKSQPTVVPR